MTNVFDKFNEYSIAEFFKKNQQMLGFSGKVRSLTTIVHEYVTNSLDAVEEHGTLPEIKIEITEVQNLKSSNWQQQTTNNDQECETAKSGNLVVQVQDNGIGIPEKFIGKAFGQMLAGTKFARYVQQRGQQGLGAAACTMYALLTTGKPIYVESRYKDTMVKCNLAIDFKTNTPIMSNKIIEQNNSGSGVLVRAEFDEVKYDNSPYGVYEYLRRTAVANPHVQITLTEPNGNIRIFPRSDEKVPAKPRDVLPHPLGITTHDLMDFAKKEVELQSLSTFLQGRFARISLNKIAELKNLLLDVDFRKAPNELNWSEAEKLANAFKRIKWIAPATDSVIPIGKEQIEKAMKNIFMPEFVSITERSPKVFKGGIPFLVEVGIAYGGNAGRGKSNGKKNGEGKEGRGGDVLRFANRVPLLFDSGSCAMTEAVKNIDWKRYGIKNFDEEAITVFINFASVHVPYAGAGKQAVFQDEEIIDEIKNAVQEAARLLEKYINNVVRERERAGKKKVILRYIDQLSKDLAELSGTECYEELKNLLNLIIEKKYSGSGENEKENDRINNEEKNVKEKLNEEKNPE